MVNKENYGISLIFSLFFFIVGLVNTVDKSFSGPIILAFSLIFAVSTIFKIKKYCNRIVYNIIVIATLVVMLILEYFLIPNNTVFYTLLLINAIGQFIAAYSLLIPEHHQNRKEKIIMWIGLIILLITFFTLLGLIYNNLTTAFIGGALASVLIGISLLIRRKDHKEYKSSLYGNYKKKQLQKKGYKLLMQGEYQEALKHFNKALEIDPKYEPALEGKEEVLNLMESKV